MRSPNPWIAVPALVAGVIGGFVGWVVADVSCRAEAGAGCFFPALLVASFSFLVAAVGVTVVLVLVYRSLAEYRQTRDSDDRN